MAATPPNPNRARKEAAKPHRQHRNAPDPFVSAEDPLAYLITFPTYGSWLHGDERGSVDWRHNVPDTPLVAPDREQARRSRERMKQPPVLLNVERRTIVHRTIVEVAAHRGWILHALNVRTNHVHLVVTADEPPERVMTTVKSWATRRMIEAGVLPRATRAWARHGSTPYLWKPDQVEAACEYVCDGQGRDLDMGEHGAC